MPIAKPRNILPRHLHRTSDVPPESRALVARNLEFTQRPIFVHAGRRRSPRVLRPLVDGHGKHLMLDDRGDRNVFVTGNSHRSTVRGMDCKPLNAIHHHRLDVGNVGNAESGKLLLRQVSHVKHDCAGVVEVSYWSPESRFIGSVSLSCDSLTEALSIINWWCLRAPFVITPPCFPPRRAPPPHLGAKTLSLYHV